MFRYSLSDLIKKSSRAFKLENVSQFKYLSTEVSKAQAKNEPKRDKYQELKNLERRPLYLDAQATTAVDPRVLDAMLPYMTNMYGNPHSRTHAYGWESEKAVEAARAVSC